VKQIVRATGFRRKHLAAARMCCERNILATIRSRSPRSAGRILCYHSVGQPQWGVNDVSPRQFRRHLDLALAAGWRFVPASEIVRTGGGPRDLAITFDDGLKSVLTNAAPILAEYGVPWSLFVVSDWAEGRQSFGEDVFLTWAEIERLAGAGVEIGSHSVTHPNFAWLDAAQAADELGTSRRVIEQRLGFAPATFAIPLGQSKNWPEVAAVAAREVGYTTVYAQAEQTHPDGTVPRTFVTQFDGDRIFRALLGGAFDRWEEWV
jgi:peptidoglycan/xylan/chitin deacetylase (PgdA/CDA1 family)